jgi:hypothetical protein
LPNYARASLQNTLVCSGFRVQGLWFMVQGLGFRLRPFLAMQAQSLGQSGSLRIFTRE